MWLRGMLEYLDGMDGLHLAIIIGVILVGTLLASSNFIHIDRR